VLQNAFKEWECTNAEEDAFCTETSIYHVCAFATLAYSAMVPELNEKIVQLMHDNICLLNDGPYVWVCLHNILFPSKDIYHAVIYRQMKKLTLESCHNDFGTFAKKFKCLFEPLGSSISLSDLNMQWGFFFCQVLAHLSPWFCHHFMTRIVNHYITYSKLSAHVAECMKALVQLAAECHDVHLTITHPQLPIKDILPLDHSPVQSSDLAALFTHVENSQGSDA